MVNGKYRCLGSTQHLKNKFGAGYTLIARVSYPADGSMPDIVAVQKFVEENFPESILKDKHQNLVQVRSCIFVEVSTSRKDSLVCQLKFSSEYRTPGRIASVSTDYTWTSCHLSGLYLFSLLCSYLVEVDIVFFVFLLILT